MDHKGARTREQRNKIKKKNLFERHEIQNTLNKQWSTMNILCFLFRNIEWSQIFHIV